MCAVALSVNDIAEVVAEAIKDAMAPVRERLVVLETWHAADLEQRRQDVAAKELRIRELERQIAALDAERLAPL